MNFFNEFQVLDIAFVDDPDSDVSRAIAGRPTVRLLEDKGTEPSVYYLA